MKLLAMCYEVTERVVRMKCNDPIIDVSLPNNHFRLIIKVAVILCSHFWQIRIHYSRIKRSYSRFDNCRPVLPTVKTTQFAYVQAYCYTQSRILDSLIAAGSKPYPIAMGQCFNNKVRANSFCCSWLDTKVQPRTTEWVGSHPIPYQSKQSATVTFGTKNSTVYIHIVLEVVVN